MTFSELKHLWYADGYRYFGGERSLFSTFLRCPAYRYTFVLRLTNYLRQKPRKAFGSFYPVSLYLYRLTVIYGIEIPNHTRIGPGLYIGHLGGIVINGDVTIGKNCNLSQGVTIGVANAGKHKGTPTIGNQVYIGPGAKIFGAITIGDSAAIGANAVVMGDVAADTSAAGVPAREVSQRVSTGMIQSIDYIRQ